MTKFANKYFGQVGEILGNAELDMYRILKRQEQKSIHLQHAGCSYDIEIGRSRETNQMKAVFVNGTPALRCNVHEVLNALEALEEYYE